jgi:hypothetical protein
MVVVLFHSGRGALPEYQESMFKQLRVFNPTIPVYFLTDTEFLNDPMFEKYSIKVIDKEGYYGVKVDSLERMYGRKPNDFWMITTTRFIYIENFIRERGLIDIYHFENDVMVYYDIQTLHNMFSALYPNLAITVGGPDKAITGFMYIKNYQALWSMTHFFVNLLRRYGLKATKAKFGMDMVNEMTLMKVYHTMFPKRMPSLPILPFGEWSKAYFYFDSIFDPASYGMFVGGNAQEKTPGCKPKDHYIGQLLIEHPEYEVIWKEDEEKRKIPYFKYNGKEVKINNLHIHSKNLHLYLS